MIHSRVNHQAIFHEVKIIAAFDGVYVSNHDKDYCNQSLHKTSKSGKITYCHYVLEAKIVTSNGLSISIGSTWIENVGEDYDKQDCELKVFVRLAAQLKKDFPRLPICATVDGLYPNQTFFKIYKKNQWDFIVTCPLMPKMP